MAGFGMHVMWLLLAEQLLSCMRHAVDDSASGQLTNRFFTGGFLLSGVGVHQGADHVTCGLVMSAAGVGRHPLCGSDLSQSHINGTALQESFHYLMPASVLGAKVCSIKLLPGEQNDTMQV